MPTSSRDSSLLECTGPRVRASVMDSPLGEILLLASEQSLCGLYFMGQRFQPELDANWQWDPTPFLSVKQALWRYFTDPGEPFRFRLNPKGTPFQKNVWDRLRRIPPGGKFAYSDVAVALRKATAVRAVGSAIGRNPISIIIPCHRVVGANGDLTGYAGGVDRKNWLLRHEAQLPSCSGDATDRFFSR